VKRILSQFKKQATKNTMNQTTKSNPIMTKGAAKEKSIKPNQRHCHQRLEWRRRTGSAGVCSANGFQYGLKMAFVLTV
jgi:hypothetical protein